MTRAVRYTGIPKIPVLNPISGMTFSNTDILKFPIYWNFSVDMGYFSYDIEHFAVYYLFI